MSKIGRKMDDYGYKITTKVAGKKFADTARGPLGVGSPLWWNHKMRNRR